MAQFYNTFFLNIREKFPKNIELGCLFLSEFAPVAF